MNTSNIMNQLETWLKTGEINPDLLADDFTFSSPYWKNADKQAFLDKFLDPTEYLEKSVSNIVGYSEFSYLVSEDQSAFALIFDYTTKYDVTVDEVVTGKVQNGKLIRMKSIYDLAQTKLAHRL